MIKTLAWFFSRTLSRQLVTMIVTIHVVLTVALVFEVISHQSKLLYQELISRGCSSAMLMRESSLRLVMGNDLVAIDNLIDLSCTLPDVETIIISDMQGQVIGHSNDGLVGKYLVDSLSLSLATIQLPKEECTRVLRKTAEMIEVGAPLESAGKRIGWVRIGFSTANTQKAILKNATQAVLIGGIAIIVGALFAWLVAMRITRKLNQLITLIREFEAGQEVDIPTSLGNDEIGLLAGTLRRMIREIVVRRQRDLAHKNELETLVQLRTEELKHSNEQATQAAEELELIIDNLPGIVFYKDTEKNYIRVNQRLAESYQMDKAEFAGKNMAELHTPDEVEKYWKDDLTVIESRKALLNVEDTLETPGGTRTILTSKIPIQDEAGAVSGILGVSIDITDRKQTEEALQVEFTKNQMLLQAGSDGIHVLDLDGNVVETSEAFCSMLGYSRDGMLGMNVSNWDAFIEAADAVSIIQGHYKGGKRVEFSTVHQRKDGSTLDVEISGQPFEINNIPLMFYSARDITERRRAENKLQESEKRLQDIVNITSDWIWEVDAEWRYTFCSSGIRRILGFRPEEVLGKRVFELDTFEDAEQSEIVFRDFAVKREPMENLEIWRRTKDGQRVCLLKNSVPIIDQDGNYAGYRGADKDITERKHFEEVIREGQELLTEANKELQRSNTELEQFAYVASHDLRAPLRAIISLSEWLEQDLADTIPPESARHLELLKGRINRMEALLDALLEFSRVGRTATDIVDIDPVGVIQDIAFSLNLEERFTLQVSEMPRFSTMHTPFHQVLRNLMGNAMKHHDKEKGKLEITAKPVGDFIEFSIKDDGPGIPEQFREKVFELFQTLKPRDELEGSGMGLALVKKIIENVGGTVAIHTVQPHGTEVRFTWPLVMERRSGNAG